MKVLFITGISSSIIEYSFLFVEYNIKKGNNILGKCSVDDFQMEVLKDILYAS
jgi:hypothetical protein